MLSLKETQMVCTCLRSVWAGISISSICCSSACVMNASLMSSVLHFSMGTGTTWGWWRREVSIRQIHYAPLSHKQDFRKSCIWPSLGTCPSEMVTRQRRQNVYPLRLKLMKLCWSLWLVEGGATLTLSTLLYSSSIRLSFSYMWCCLDWPGFCTSQSVQADTTISLWMTQYLYGPAVEGAGCGSSSQTRRTVGLCFYRTSWRRSCISPSLQPPPMPNPPLTGNVRWAAGEHGQE